MIRVEVLVGLQRSGRFDSCTRITDKEVAMIRKYYLAIKYYLLGDPWVTAIEYAEYITRW